MPRNNILNTATVVGAFILVGYTIVALTAIVRLQDANRKNAIRHVSRNLQTHKQYVENVFERAVLDAGSVKSMAMELRASGSASRPLMSKLLKANVLSNTDFLGLWMVWEPNAFDGNDAAHTGEGGSDENGRFAPYWHWYGDSVVLETCIDFETSDYYLLPKQHRNPLLLEPYVYPISGNDSLLLSVVVPIIEEGEFLGVAGVDIRLNVVKSLIRKVAFLENGNASLISGGGIYIEFSHAISEAGLFEENKENLRAYGKTTDGKDVYYEDEDDVYFIADLVEDMAINPWQLTLSVPQDQIKSDMISIRFSLLLFSTISALLMLLLLIYASAQRFAKNRNDQKMKEQISESDARLTSHIEGGEGKVNIYSLDNQLRYTGFNSVHRKQMKETYGMNVELGLSILDHLSDSMRLKALENFQRALGGEQFYVTNRINDKYYRQTFNPVYNDKSEVIGLTSNLYEVTDRILAEQELESYRDRLEELVEIRTKEIERQKEFFQQILDHLPVMVFVRSVEHKYVLVNQLFAKSFGKPANEIIGNSLLETHEDLVEAKKYRNEDAEIIESGVVFGEEYQMSWPGSDEKNWFYLTKHRMTVGGDRFILGVYVDVTYLKITELKLKSANEELSTALDHLKSTQMRLIESEKMASVGLLTAGLAHEINNPINYIGGNALVIQRDLKELTEHLETIKSQFSDQVLSTDHAFSEISIINDELNSLISSTLEGTTRVSGLVRDLNAFAGQRRTNLTQEIVLNKCIVSTVNLVKHQPGKDIEFDIDLEEEFEISGNEQSIKQVILNVLTNACQAINERGVVSIKAANDDRYVYLEIGDTGSGIPEVILNRIFEPFFTTKEVGSGSGLGLAISYNIMNEMGGGIRVVRSSSTGTVFELKFPLLIGS